MSTPNFVTMENFPLYVCCLDVSAEQSELDEYDMTAEEYAQMTYDDEYENLTYLIEKYTKETPLQFHKIEVKDGYYGGMQLYVDDDNDGYGVPTDHDNESCRIIWDMCRSKAIRAYKSEINKVKRILKKIKNDLNLTELECLGVFSNGEAVYSKVQ